MTIVNHRDYAHGTTQARPDSRADRTCRNSCVINDDKVRRETATE